MFEYGRLFRPRLSALFVAVTVFVSPVVAQQLDPCFLDCHKEGKRAYEAVLGETGDEAWANRAANVVFMKCMDDC